MKHNHRILPGHMGGDYTEGNVICVEVTSCDMQTANHVMWHYANWTLYKKEEDLVAWKGLSGYHNKENFIQERCRLGGQISGAKLRDSGKLAEIGRRVGKIATLPGGWLYENRHEYSKLGYAAGIGKPENRMPTEERKKLAKEIYNQGKGLASITREKRKEIGRKGGTKSGLSHKQNKTGVCAISPEEHSKRMAETNKQKWSCPVCGFVGSAKSVNKHMHEEHSLPKDAKVKTQG